MSKFLIVEDETDLQPILDKILRPFQGNLDWVGNVDQAKAKLGGGPYDLVISDHTFAGGRANGLDLFKFCQEKFPGLPFILISGLPGDVFDSMVKLGLSLPPFLEKPFSVEECRGIVECALKFRKAG